MGKSLLDRLVEAIREIDSHEIDKLLEKSDERDQEDRDLRPLRVMISSVLNGLVEERERIDKAVARMSDVKVKLFENLDSGHDNETESIQLVHQCDVFVAIFDPGNPGTMIDRGPNARRYFSEMEFEAAVARKNRPPSKWPLIFTFVKGSMGVALQPWQEKCINEHKFSPTKYFETAEDWKGKFKNC